MNWLIIVCVSILYNSQGSSCTDNHNNINLKLTIEDKGNGPQIQCHSSPKYTLLEDYAEIIIINDDEQLNSITKESRCFDSKNKSNFYTEDLRTFGAYPRKQIKKMEAKSWTCEFFVLIQLGPVLILNTTSCNFKVHMRLTHGPEFKVNDVPVDWKRTNVATTDFDYIGEYYFEPDNVPVNISCTRTKHAGFIVMRWMSANSKNYILEKSEQVESEKSYFNVTLKPEHNNTYLTCAWITQTDELLLKIHLYLGMKKLVESHLVRMEINDEPVKFKRIFFDYHSDLNYYNSEYHFVPGKTVTFRCRVATTNSSLMLQWRTRGNRVIPLKPSYKGDNNNGDNDRSYIIKLTQSHQDTYIYCGYSIERYIIQLKALVNNSTIKANGEDKIKSEGFPTWAIALITVLTIVAFTACLLRYLCGRKRSKPTQMQPIQQQTTASCSDARRPKHQTQREPVNNEVSREKTILSPDYGRPLRRIPGLKVDLENGTVTFNDDLRKFLEKEQHTYEEIK